jgi:hypothetical protein
MLVAFKLKIALACAAGLAGPFAVAPLLSDLARHEVAPSEQSIIDVKPGAMFYRVAGDFIQSGKPAEAPLSMLRFVAPLTIMKHQGRPLTTRPASTMAAAARSTAMSRSPSTGQPCR